MMPDEQEDIPKTEGVTEKELTVEEEEIARQKRFEQTKNALTRSS